MNEPVQGEVNNMSRRVGGKAKSWEEAIKIEVSDLRQ
jgi:hypothetical protein